MSKKDFDYDKVTIAFICPDCDKEVSLYDAKKDGWLDWYVSVSQIAKAIEWGKKHTYNEDHNCFIEEFEKRLDVGKKQKNKRQLE